MNTTTEKLTGVLSVFVLSGVYLDFAVAAFGIASNTSLLPGAEMWMGNQVDMLLLFSLFSL